MKGTSIEEHPLVSICVSCLAFVVEKGKGGLWLVAWWLANQAAEKFICVARDKGKRSCFFGGQNSTSTPVLVFVYAMATSSNLQSLRELFSCSICLELYTRPLFLSSCMHSFCEGCLQPLITDKSITCPLCRKLSLVPYGTQVTFTAAFFFYTAHSPVVAGIDPKQ